MPIKVEKNNLVRFGNKVKKRENLADYYALAFVEAAFKIAKDKYAGVPELEALEIERTDYGVYRLVAKGSQLCYIEFGTGIAGLLSGYPKENLPTMPLSFESPVGFPQTTQGWEYYYDNPLTKVSQGPNEGWYAYNPKTGKVEFTDGQLAGFQMYNTAKELADKLVEIAKEFAERRKR